MSTESPAAAFESALRAVGEFGGAQGGVAATEALVADNFDVLVYRWKVADMAAALRDARQLLGAGAEVKFTVSSTEGTLTFTAKGSDRWSFGTGPQPGLLLPRLAEVGPQTSWVTDELIAGDWDAAAAVITAAEANAEFAKSLWTSGIEGETNRSVWIGPDQAGFAAWLEETVPGGIAKKLFAKPAALALLADWPESGPATAGDSLTVGSLSARPRTEAKDPELLVPRLAERREEERLQLWRLLRVDTHSDLPDRLREPLNRAVGLAAARLIAVEEGGKLRPASDRTEVWVLPPTPGRGPSDVDAIVELARWVGADLSEIRFAVAGEIAARLIGDPLDGGPAGPPRDAARIAYRRAVHDDVAESLARQQKLEESFRALDDQAAAMRASTDETVDGTVAKSLAGALAIAIAALTSSAVRDWPATIAAFVLAGYLGVSALTLASWRRNDADVRLEEAGEYAAQRVEGLGDQLKESSQTWRARLKRRVHFAVGLLWALAGLLAIGGLLANGSVRAWLGF